MRWSKLERCFDSEMVEIVFVAPQRRGLPLSLLRQLGVKIKSGEAPAGAMEREAASWLHELLHGD